MLQAFINVTHSQRPFRNKNAHCNKSGMTCCRQRSTKLSTTFANVWTNAFRPVVDILSIRCELCTQIYFNWIVCCFIIIINRAHPNSWQQSASILCYLSLYPIPRGWALCLLTGEWRGPILVFQASFVRVVVFIKLYLLLLHCFANSDQQVEVCAFLLSRKCVENQLRAPRSWCVVFSWC